MTTMQTQKEISEINKQLDDVIATGHEFAIGWLRGAFHTHKSGMAHVLAEFNELRQLYLSAVTRPLTVREGQLLNVCRICRKKYGAPFVLNYGKEFACQSCVESEKCKPSS